MNEVSVAVEAKKASSRRGIFIAFVCTTAASLLISFWVVHRLLGGAICGSDLATHRPLLIFPGATRAHYAEEHRVALSAYDFLDASWGKWAAISILLAVCFGWGLALWRLRSASAKVLISAALPEATLCGLNVFYAAAMAHHQLWCNYQWWICLLIVHFALVLPPLGIVMVFLNHMLPRPFGRASSPI